jgi:formamidopyrimidine-DNA glycosylase
VPELPEVENVVRTVAPRITGQRIVSAEVLRPRIVAPQWELIQKHAPGREIVRVSRHAKFIVLELSGGVLLSIHLGMTGKLLTGREPSAHTRAVFRLTDGHLKDDLLLFDDPRMFGRIDISVSGDLPRVARLGPDALGMGPGEFREALIERRGRMKTLLLNQRVLGGVGNIYADEILFEAGVHPRALCARVSKQRVQRIWEAMQRILREAIAAGGSSVSDYVNAEGEKGSFQLQHRVYRRTGLPCVRCGAAIRRILMGQRSTHYCPKCQRP